MGYANMIYVEYELDPNTIIAHELSFDFLYQELIKEIQDRPWSIDYRLTISTKANNMANVFKQLLLWAYPTFSPKINKNFLNTKD